MARNPGGSTPAAPAGARDSGSTVLAAKPPVGHLQTAEARRDRATQVKDRQKQAKALLSLPKPVRQAIQVARIAQREGYAGAGKSMAKAGLGKKPSTYAMNDIASGRMMLRTDYGKRKGKLTEGQRQSIYKTMVRSGNTLKGRQRIRAVGARVRGMGGARRLMVSRKPKGVVSPRIGS